MSEKGGVSKEWQRSIGRTRRLAVFLGVLILGSGIWAHGASVAQADARAIVVQRGDALSLLAVRFQVTVEELRRWNHLDSDRIQAGQELRLAPTEVADAPAANPSAPAASATDAHPATPTRSTADQASTAHEATSHQATSEDADHASTDDEAADDDAADETGGDEADEADGAAPSPSRSRRADSEQVTPPAETLSYVVRRGDTLSGIAVSQGTTLEALRRLNDGLRPDRIREGQSLHLPVPDAPLRDHVVRRGESLGSIAQRFQVRPRDLRRWNASLGHGRLQLGEHLRIYSEVRESLSESIGQPSRGTLAHAERLPPDPGYAIREPSRAYGTLETTTWLSEGVDAVREEFSNAPRIAVHDLSARSGGRLRGHRSHQSGRDADLSYYQRACGNMPCPFRRLDPAQLDLARQWALLQHWLEHDEVEYVFIDYGLQRGLYDYARAQGATRAQLERWFQYPRGRSHPLGIIRHFHGHRDHLHVRFVCPDTDEDCR